jgi:hypothetical protein
VARLAEAARVVPPAQGVYLESDFVMNMLATVVDFQTHTTAVERALGHFRSRRWDEVRTIDDLKAVFARFPADQAGNTALAEFLWGYKMWTRANMLRGLVAFFDGIGVRDQVALVSWAAGADFRRDFEGRVRGLGPAVFQWLVMRQGVETVKPDVHVRRFAEAVLGRRLNDDDLVAVVTGAALSLGVKAYELDWAIWEYQRGVTG